MEGLGSILCAAGICVEVWLAAAQTAGATMRPSVAPEHPAPSLRVFTAAQYDEMRDDRLRTEAAWLIWMSLLTFGHEALS